MAERFKYFKSGQYPGDVIKKFNASGSSYITRSKYSARGGIAGAIIGFIAAAYWHKPKLMGLALGAIGGAIIGNLYSKLEEKIKIIKEYESSKATSEPKSDLRS